MLFTKFVFGAFALLVIDAVDFGDSILLTGGITSQIWTDYKRDNNKTYTTAVEESYAQYYFNYNRQLVLKHNLLEDRNQRTFRLEVNQFSDMRLIQFNQLFPKTMQPATPNASPLPAAQEPGESFSPITDLGINPFVENQGTLCNSGWAYAVAKSIELMGAMQMGTVAPARLSAQNLIDCAGQSRACTNQIPQIAFDYLAVNNQGIYLESQYPNNNYSAQQGMCLRPPAGAVPTNLATYSRIPEAEDTTMKKYVAAGFPVVVEVNPTTFEFMHYKSGVFQPPRTNTQGSHYMVVIGYGTDTVRNLDYWLVQNSFGTGWGEEGFMRIIRNAANQLAKSALFPTELGP